MKFIAVLLLSLSTSLASAQTVVSSCNAPDSILDKYAYHAAELALRRIFDERFAEIDSFTIPQSSRDSVLAAIVAVYNAVGLPARDTVMAFAIMPMQTEAVRWLRLEADSNASWMQALLGNDLPTGNTALDSLISTYNCTITYTSTRQRSTIAIADLELDDYYNLGHILDNIILDTLTGIMNIDLLDSGFDLDDMTYKVFPTYRQLNFIHRWGDCPNGCTYNRTWTFNVYDDCSVEYAGSFGDPLVGTEEPTEK